MLTTRLHIEAVGGVAGDMLLAALIDLGASVSAIEQTFNSLRISELALQLNRVTVLGEHALHVRSIAPHQEHAHRHLSEIMALIDRAAMSAAAQARARAIFSILAAAEGTVHESTADDVHLHEVGELDSVMDVLGIAVALDTLGNPTVTASALPSGQGTVLTSHGELQVPVPAVVEIATRHAVPLLDVALVGETVTPTGIAVVAQCVLRFEDLVGQVKRTGVGAGTRRFANTPNVVRIHEL